mgnify:CR=1 FL=1
MLPNRTAPTSRDPWPSCEELECGGVDGAVVSAIEVIRLQDLRDLSYRVLVDEHRAEDEIQVITDKYSGRSRGFGFVEMPDSSEAQKAIGDFKLLGKTLFTPNAK